MVYQLGVALYIYFYLKASCKYWFVKIARIDLKVALLYQKPIIDRKNLPRM